jgi:5-methylcytosine-specific restriction endonuclease McrA
MPSMTLTCVICNEPMQKSRTSAPQGRAAHNVCKTLNKHGLSGYRRGCRCDTCRAAQNEACKEYARRRAERDGVTQSAQWRRKKRGVEARIQVPCTVCGEPLAYVRTEPVRRPMHKACKIGQPDWFVRGRDNPKVTKMRAAIAKAAAGTTGGARVFTSGPCPWCGEQFTKAQAKWCSAKCKASSKFAARSTLTFTISPKARLAIYERDGWTCQLCQLPVSKLLHYLDDWSASLDHVIPQSHQLVPDHSSNALRLAHRWCNSARGDGSNMTETELRARAEALLKAA